MPIIAVANQKGGVGKTTTVVNLGSALQERGKRVLVVDLDPQASLTVHLGLKAPESLEFNIGHVLRAEATSRPWPKASDAVLATPAGLDLIPSGKQLLVAESVLHNSSGREFVLRDVLAPVLPKYDYVLIDCLPTSGILVTCAFAAADSVLVPLQTDYLALHGLAKILQTVADIRGRLNPDLEILGVLLTMVDVRTGHSRQVVSAVRNIFGENVRVFDTSIRNSVGFKEASKAGMSILRFDTRSPGADAYRTLASELLSLQYVSPTPSESERAAQEATAAIEEAASLLSEHALKLEAAEQAMEMESAGDSSLEHGYHDNGFLSTVPVVERPGEGSIVTSHAPVEICPFLRALNGNAAQSAEASDSYYCFADATPMSLDLATQRSLCLTGRHTTCPRVIRQGLLHKEEQRRSVFARILAKLKR